MRRNQKNYLGPETTFFSTLNRLVRKPWPHLGQSLGSACARGPAQLEPNRARPRAHDHCPREGKPGHVCVAQDYAAACESYHAQDRTRRCDKANDKPWSGLVVASRYG